MLSDSATLTGGYNVSGTVTFDFYGPGDPMCSGLGHSSTRAGTVISDAAAVSGGVGPTGTVNFAL